MRGCDGLARPWRPFLSNEDVAEVMARELGWGEAETTAQVSRYQAKVATEKAR